MIVQEIIDFLAKKEVLILFIILLAAILLYIILWVISFIKKKDEQKKLKTNTQELTKLAEKVKLLEKEQQEAALPPVFRIEQEKVREEIKPLVMEEKKEPPKVVVKETFTSPVAIEPVVAEVVMPKKEENVITKEIKLNDNSVSEVEILDANPLEITYKNEVYTKEEAKEELKRLERQLIEQDKKEEKPIFEPIEVKPFKEVTNDEVIPVLDEMLDTKEEEVKQENISLTNFEEDQEQNAIISLDELLKRGNTITQDEIIKHEDDGDEPITLQELEAKWKKDKEVIALKNDDEDIEVLETKKEEVPFSYEDIKVEAPKVKIPTMDELFSKSKTPYKPTPVISPIFGIEEDKISSDNSLKLENTANYDKLDAEIRKTNEFLSKLKELQKKLDN